MNHAIIKSELAHRELARRHYTGYLAYVHGPSRIPTRMSQYIASRVQEFLETNTGHTIIQTLRRKMHIIPVTPLGGKVARVNAVSAAIESGHVFVPPPSRCPWVNDFLDQFTAFPNAPHDDMVDACSQALNRMIYARGELPEEKETEPEKYPTLMQTLYTPYKRQ